MFFIKAPIGDFFPRELKLADNFLLYSAKENDEQTKMISVFSLFLIPQENLASGETSGRTQALPFQVHQRWIWDQHFFH